VPQSITFLVAERAAFHKEYQYYQDGAFLDLLNDARWISAHDPLECILQTNATGGPYELPKASLLTGVIAGDNQQVSAASLAASDPRPAGNPLCSELLTQGEAASVEDMTSPPTAGATPIKSEITTTVNRKAIDDATLGLLSSIAAPRSAETFARPSQTAAVKPLWLDSGGRSSSDLLEQNGVSHPVGANSTLQFINRRLTSERYCPAGQLSNPHSKDPQCMLNEEELNELTVLLGLEAALDQFIDDVGPRGGSL
jgi:hypothetical protein